MKQNYTKLLFVLLIFFGGIGDAFSQCSQEQMITICDMETIDFDFDGIPDGIINLYDETGIVPESGDFWESTGIEEGEEGIEASGVLRLWQLRNASDLYFFELKNPNCPDDYRVRVNVKLGPYAGIAATTGFFPVCDNDDICTAGFEIDINLFDTLESREGFALPHLNGIWTYTGSLPSDTYILSGSNFGTTIENNGGFPVDSEDFSFRYTVFNVDTCITEFVDVQVTVVRPVTAGYGSSFSICEGDIGSWDMDINLFDDRFLNGEELGGSWEDDDNTGQITSATDAVINLKEVYDAFRASPEYVPGFSCIDFSYTYKINSRSPICPNDEETVMFVIYEELRPFAPQNSVEEICPNSSPAQINLFDLLEFEPGYVYTDGSLVDDFAYWTFLGGIPFNGDLNLENNLNDTPEDEQHLGPITIAGARPGSYRFRYDVVPRQSCGATFSYSGDVCQPISIESNPCPTISTIVTIVILPHDYAGEDTLDLIICKTDANQYSLRSLLNSDGRTIEEGIWTDNNNGGNVVDDLFLVPEEINDPISYSFTHTTTNPSGCVDEALLEFTIYKEANAGAGSGTATSLCSDNLTVTLFNLLEGNPDPTGTWIGPFGYMSPDHLGIFDASDNTLPILGPGDYVYTVGGNVGCSSQDQATVTIAIVEPVEIGNDRSDSFCEIDGRVNLFTILDNNTPRTGTFQDIENTGALTPDGVVEFDLLPNPDNEVNKIYNFRYVIPNTAPCNESSLNVEVQIIDLPEPNVPDQEFCILDGKRLDDIEVDVLNYNWYPTLESDMPIIDNPLLFDNQIYYIATVDADNCESERVTVAVNILNMGERFSNGDICALDFQDGVSPDGNNQNDTFDLFIEDEFNIPVAFPDFDLKIYNRYGAKVFEGNRNTEEFRGESNVSIRLGDDLPSGTYFYIFTPNFENNFPIQGSFYLSR
ncbi:gliding motility-associated C-terminal domain-containing protein [Aquimarina sp. MMG015]|uniref:T9SS type B sorting domain-containing protein n=1 Tax=Aquimarina sp. MMG015 TaxID=2822689 RepID=UPI001B3A11F1|nr:gliding motility-associated C-terminal domain-containing protein [Aquimarina sp. MMG015]MBQ4802438.1 gliding motility-associated C-terminal domain-containing protein [Aquimarina sp. MMG015]